MFQVFFNVNVKSVGICILSQDFILSSGKVHKKNVWCFSDCLESRAHLSVLVTYKYQFLHNVAWDTFLASIFYIAFLFGDWTKSSVLFNIIQVRNIKVLCL